MVIYSNLLFILKNVIFHSYVEVQDGNQKYLVVLSLFSFGNFLGHTVNEIWEQTLR